MREHLNGPGGKYGTESSQKVYVVVVGGGAVLIDMARPTAETKFSLRSRNRNVLQFYIGYI